ncbi:MAG TPA: TonB-dependent receptor, partial [Candidatus Aminicenantes bacterium]|nr:TonB-dependent receptor [Candidatus Aminicenantes bacterium]
MKKISLILVLSLLLVSALTAQTTQTGSLRGTVNDTEGTPLPGVTVTITGPSLIGSESVITNEKGFFRVPVLPPGTYEVVAELSGFQTVRRGELIIRVGKTVTITFEIAAATIAEEITVIAPSPPVDVVSAKTTASVDKETLQVLPLARSVYAVLSLVPGTTNRSIKGGARNNHAFQIDGVLANAVDQNYGEVDISWETIEEIEIVTGGAGAEVFQGIGGMINIVTKSGGNKFSGQVQTYYTSEDFSKSVVPEEKLRAVGAGVPEAAISDWDVAFILGGPVIKDKIWFLGNFRYTSLQRYSSFIPTTILGQTYDIWDYVRKMSYGFGKVSAQLAKNIRVFGMFNYGWFDEPHQQYWNSRLTAEAQNHNHRYQITTSFNMAWILNPNTFVDVRAGSWLQDWSGKVSDEGDANGPYFYDAYTGYHWGRHWLNGYTLKDTKGTSAKLTHFQDDFLGADHEFKIGIEYQIGEAHWGYWNPNGTTWNYYDGSPYYYRGLYGLDSAHPEYGDGYLTMSSMPPQQGDRKHTDADISWKRRIGFFIQDSITIKNRLTVNLGVRYDTIKGWIPELIKTPSGDALAKALSAAYIEPLYGVDPFGSEFSWDKWDDPFPYSFLAPSIGIAYDLFGDGKTALKASWGMYPEGLPTWHYGGMIPSGGWDADYYWWDTNGNGEPDLPPTDDYQFVPNLSNLPDYIEGRDYLDKIPRDLKLPYEHQFMATIEHELFTDFRVSLNYTYKTRRNELTMWFYDRATSQYWSDNMDYWVPFNTTVPAIGEEFPAVDVTVYYLKDVHPETFTRMTNVPEDLHKQRYHSIELSFDKRMSRGWSLGGSFVYTDLKGNVPYSGGTAGWVDYFQQPNYATNRYGDLRFSLPVMIKL